jgi:hypothetical protein
MARIYIVILLLVWTLHGASYEFEVGGFYPKFTGDITNPSSTATFDDDLAYRHALISYFGTDIKFFHPYIPDIKLGYLNIMERQSVALAENKTFAKQDYNGSITSQIDYKVLNLTLYKTMHQPLSINFRGESLPLGDIFFELGGNIKYLDYSFDVHNHTDDPLKDSIVIDTFILMPYFGFRYQYGIIALFANGSALGFSDARADSIRGGMSIRLMKHLSINGGYMYENTKLNADDDKVTFTSAGPYGSISIHF